jgi:hypothetical protein
MDALGLWMDGYAGSIFHWAGILPTFLHIFLATINAMALIFKQFVILSADLHTYHAVVLEELVIVLYKTFLVVFTLLVTVLTPYHPLQQRAGGRLNVRAKVREAIKKQLQYACCDRPAHNKRRNLN